MLTFQVKISHLESYLNKEEENYADSFKTDILFYFNEFDETNPDLKFLEKLDSIEQIENWVDKLTSRIVMKFDEDGEQINDFIHEYLLLVLN